MIFKGLKNIIVLHKTIYEYILIVIYKTICHCFHISSFSKIKLINNIKKLYNCCFVGPYWKFTNYIEICKLLSH